MLGSVIGAIGSIGGGILGKVFGDDSADQAWKRQKKVLQNQIQWKVADAVKAGLHPLAGLGVNPASGPAASVGGESLAAGFADMGQNLGRAAEAYATPQDKASSRLIELQLERGVLENDLLRSQIASQRMRNIQQATPGLPGPSRLPVPAIGGIPAKPGSDWPVTNPGLGAAAEEHYSDIGGNVFGGLAMVQDALKYMGVERLLTPTEFANKYVPIVRNAIGSRVPRLPPRRGPGGNGGRGRRY